MSASSAPDKAVPTFNADGELVSRRWPDGRVDYYEGSKKTRTTVLNGTTVHYQEKGQLCVFKNGDEKYYEGRGSAARLKYTRFADGTTEHYDGPPERERLVRIEYPDGQVQYYTGEHDKEWNTHIKRANGNVVHYDQEGCLTRIERKSDGRVEHYGPGERLERIERADGDVAYYDHERIVTSLKRKSDGAVKRYARDGRCTRIEYANGKVTYYEGEFGKERRTHTTMPDGGATIHYGDDGGVTRIEYTDGRVDYYEGEHEKERRTHVRMANGDVVRYDHEERVRRVERKRSKTVEHYTGERCKEWKTHAEQKNGTVILYDVHGNVLEKREWRRTGGGKRPVEGPRVERAQENATEQDVKAYLEQHDASGLYKDSMTMNEAKAAVKAKKLNDEATRKNMEEAEEQRRRRKAADEAKTEREWQASSRLAGPSGPSRTPVAPEDIVATAKRVTKKRADIDASEKAKKRLQEERKALADAELAAQEERLRALRLARDIGGS